MNTTAQKILIVIVALGLALMLGTTVYQRLADPSLVTQGRTAPAGQASGVMPSDMPPGMDGDSEIGRLMRMAGEAPNNPDTLCELGVALISQGKYREAGTFLERARTMDVNNADIPYYLGYIAHQLKEHEKAVALMEESLAIKDRADVHFSTATILRYFLHDDDRALAHIRQGVAAPDCTEEQRALYTGELAKAGSKQ
ncbi:MAG: tetratricopeptide repeat protein [Desulfovibrionaceae bacterium]|nr:tetratricopeptide repeat protein [Desulfovibrionaceae bacterium]